MQQGSKKFRLGYAATKIKTYLPSDPFAAPTRRARLEEFNGREVLDMQLAVEIFGLPSVDIFKVASDAENFADFMAETFSWIKEHLYTGL